jgi:hypothetical protein
MFVVDQATRDDAAERAGTPVFTPANGGDKTSLSTESKLNPGPYLQLN